MTEPVNTFDLLDKLRKQNGKRVQRFGDVKKYLSFKARDKGIPVSGQFELTPLCNLSCKMCYVHLSADQLKGQSILPVETWKSLMHQAWEAGMISASLTGGECLTYPGFDELFLYLHSLGCEVAVLTNGILLNEKRIQFFKEHTPSLIQVTLYGWNDDVYERVTGQRVFSIVAENIKRAVDADLPIYITLTPSIYLGEDLLETIRVAKRLCKTVKMNAAITIPREETGRSGQRDDAEDDLYIRAYKLFNEINGVETIEIEKEKLPPCGGPSHESTERGLRCGGGRSSFDINWKGTMTPCASLDIIQGYPLEEGFAAAWAKVNREANQWPRVPECDGCQYNGICNNCAANMLRFAEPGKMPTALCEQTMKFVCNGVRHLPECE